MQCEKVIACVIPTSTYEVAWITGGALAHPDRLLASVCAHPLRKGDG